jgi:transposase
VNGPIKRRNRTGKEKLCILLEAMAGQDSVGEVCSRHHVNQTQYYLWRERLLREGEKIFNFGGPGREQECLKLENMKLKAQVRELKLKLAAKQELLW